MTKLGEVILRDTRANQPAAGVEGRLYYVTDESVLERDSGSAWQSVSSAGFANPMTTAGDIIKGGTSGAPQRLAIGSSGQVLTVSAGAPAWAAPSGNPSHAYFSQLAALLEPLAIEKMQTGTFSYAVGSSETKWLIASYWTRFGSSGRMEQRFPFQPMPLRNITLAGIDSTSAAALIDPTLPTYTDAWTTYYDRLNTIATSAIRTVALTAASQKQPLLMGAYGGILLNVTSFNFTWVIANFQATWGLNLMNEIGDTGATEYQRVGHTLYLPLSKFVCNETWSGASGGTGTPLGAVAFMLCESTWGKVTDPNTYILRDDFMGASLNTGSTWTRVQSTAGNVEINTTYQWLKMLGNTVWGDNGLFTQSTTARSAGKIFLCDVYIPSGSSTPNLILGWHDGAGQLHSDFAHGVDFTQNAGNKLQVFENGNDRGYVGSGWSVGCTYRVRITLGASNAAYAIQGGTEYAALGGASWTDITPGTTSSSTTPLAMGASINSAVTVYLSDMRVY